MKGALSFSLFLIHKEPWITKRRVQKQASPSPKPAPAEPQGWMRPAKKSRDAPSVDQLSWTCQACTLMNDAPLALACSLCGTHRMRAKAEPLHSDLSAPTIASSDAPSVVDDGTVVDARGEAVAPTKRAEFAALLANPNLRFLLSPSGGSGRILSSVPPPVQQMLSFGGARGKALDSPSLPPGVVSPGALV